MVKRKPRKKGWVLSGIKYREVIQELNARGRRVIQDKTKYNRKKKHKKADY